MKIGILGKIRAGKDSISELISQHIWKMGTKIPTEYFSFSTGIYYVIQLTLPKVYQQRKPRKALQHIGQSLRLKNPDI